MNYQLEIEANSRPETIERILRVTRHRGFRVESLDMKTQPDQKALQMTLNVCSDRPLALLTNQLEKMIDITSLCALDPLCSEQKRA